MAAGKVRFVIEQGATFERTLKWLNPKNVFRAQNAGTSDAAAPTFPPDVNDTVVDNDITWLNLRKATEEDLAAYEVWHPGTAYAKDALILTPDDPVDITSYTACMQFRTAVADEEGSEILFEITDVADANNNQLVLGGVTGEIIIRIQDPDTQDFDWESSEFDLELIAPPDATYPTGFHTRLIYGTILISKERTRK